MKKLQTRADWLHDISWSHEGSSSTHGKAGSRSKFRSLTLTLTHNATRISVTGSTSYIQNKRQNVRDARMDLWWKLFKELEQKLSHLEQEAGKRNQVPEATSGFASSVSPDAPQG